jgi:Delta7-sterol 5-desaturase
MAILPQHPFAYVTFLFFAIVGIRFFVIAGAVFFFIDPSRKKNIGRAQIPRPKDFQLTKHVRREVAYSIFALVIFSFINALFFGYGWIQHSFLYNDISEYPLWWFWISIALAIVLHDTFFYWLHRALHTRFLFNHVHRLHHESRYPTAFAAYSFSWQEAAAEFLIVMAVFYVIPMHLLAIFIFQTISIAYNAYGHCGVEFFPEGASGQRVASWFNTSSRHAFHHRRGHGNYSLYFSFWDRIMGTLKDDSEVSVAQRESHGMQR